MRIRSIIFLVVFSCLFMSCQEAKKSIDIPSNTWIMVDKVEKGSRRFSSFRYVEKGGYFLLWGDMGHFVYENAYGGPHTPIDQNPEYDIVTFNIKNRTWENQLPFEKQEEWSSTLPPIYRCNYYKGITTGSYRPQLKMRDGVFRPDLNIVCDQVTYDTRRSRMVYFTGGRTFEYDTVQRVWSDIGSDTSPPPVMGGSLCYDPFNDEIVLVGGGHVAESGPDGKPVGYTGTWIYNCETKMWKPLQGKVEPPPRMISRLVCDTKNKVLVLFGGDAQSYYRTDTWIYDTRTRTWHSSQAKSSPPPRAGHFTVYDPHTRWVIIGGGYNRENLSDMWAYDAATDQWHKLKGNVPTGWYITADIKPDEGLIILTTSKTPDDLTRDIILCNDIFEVRRTYAFRIKKEGLIDQKFEPIPQNIMYKRSLEESIVGVNPNKDRRDAQVNRLSSLPDNQWVLQSGPERIAPLRTWGTCSFDTDKGRIIYWGGGHCGYGGSGYDLYDVEQNTWLPSPLIAEYPERAWDMGINPAGITFSGAPWMRHSRKIYAYDPISKLIINMKTIVLTAGYEPDCLRDYMPRNPDFGSGENFTQSGYIKWVTWGYNPENEEWGIICSGIPGMDLTVTTPHGVMAVDYNWGALTSKERPDIVTFNGKQVVENAVYLLDVAGRTWKKLSTTGPWPQNLTENTNLVYDSKRDHLILHGGGARGNEIWIFEIDTGRWIKKNPVMALSRRRNSPVCRREGVYIPPEDTYFTLGYEPDKRDDPGVYVYRVSENAWYRVNIPPPVGRYMKNIVRPNLSITYDSIYNLVMMLIGEIPYSNLCSTQVYALRYNHKNADYK